MYTVGADVTAIEFDVAKAGQLEIDCPISVVTNAFGNLASGTKVLWGVKNYKELADLCQAAPARALQCNGVALANDIVINEEPVASGKNNFYIRISKANFAIDGKGFKLSSNNNTKAAAIISMMANGME